MLEAYALRRAELEGELSACPDVKAAADCLGKMLEKLRQDVRLSEDSLEVRREADRLFDAAKQAALLIMTVTEADISVIAPRAGNLSLKERLIDALPWASAAIGALLSVWMMLIEQKEAAVAALVLAALGVIEALVQTRATPHVRAQARVDAYELLRMTDRLVQALAHSLDDIHHEREKLSSAEQPRLTGDLIEPVQMLMEAVYTGDGDYALKAAPQLVSALGAQGVELIGFSPENRRYFDLFPSTEPGVTIRPALLKNGQLLARGQATEQV